MAKKPKQSKKARKSSKRTEVAAKPADEIDTDSMSASTEVSQATLTTQEADVAVEPQHALAQAAPEDNGRADRAKERRCARPRERRSAQLAYRAKADLDRRGVVWQQATV
jgi:hypothetical protein